MNLHPFGPLPPVSPLTLGGGGLGMVWGAATFDECVATVHAAVGAGIGGHLRYSRAFFLAVQVDSSARWAVCRTAGQLRRRALQPADAPPKDS